MDGSTLTEIHAVCYQDKPDDELPRSPPEFHAVMGHILVRTPDQHPNFPPASSWVVEGQYVQWGSQGSSKSVSIKIVWKLKGGEGSPSYSKYNIYVEKLPESEADGSVGKLGEAKEFIGTAHVTAFYVSKLAVPSGISIIRFTIQVCGDDGACQELGESPSFQLKVQG